jgi:hypothetical protein
MARPIKILFCHSDPDYIVNLSNFFNFPANLSQELKEKLEQEQPRSFDFHGITNYYEALNLLVKANLEGQQTSGYYGPLPFELFVCEVNPPRSSTLGQNDTDAWDILSQIHKLDLCSAALLERYDQKGTLTEDIYRPPLCTVAMVAPKNKTLELVEQLLSVRVTGILPLHLPVDELQSRLKECHQNYFCGVSQIRVTSDLQKSRKGEPTAARQMLRWKTLDGQQESFRGVCLEQLPLKGTDINIEDYRGKVKELFSSHSKFRELSLKLIQRRCSQ